MPALLDVIEVPVAEPKPLPYQPEDWLLAPGRWRRDRRADKANIDRWVDPPAPLWENGFDSNRGKNDRFLYDPVKQLDGSARFIGVPALEIRVSEHKKDDEQTSFQLRGAFEYEGQPYILRITDIGYEERYAPLGAGTYKLGKAYVTVTVGEPFSRAEGEPEYHYKLIAAIIEA